jgi:hypothetical protein
MVGLGKTLVKEKRLFYYLESSHKIFYTTNSYETGFNGGNTDPYNYDPKKPGDPWGKGFHL